MSLLFRAHQSHGAEFSITSAETRGNPNVVTVTFSAPVSPVSATNPANYGITPGVTVNSVSMIEATKVRLHTSLITEGPVYTLVVSTVQDTATPPNEIALNSMIHFVQSQGAITRREFHNISGVLLSDLTNYSKFTGNQPDTTTLTPSLEAPLDVRDDYGLQFLGYVTAPTTGDYTFYLSSDDQGALFLSSNDQPANKLLIAEEPVWNGSRQFINGSNQGSRIQPGVDFFASAIFIEAEDFDYGGGLFVGGIPIGMDGPYAGGAYAGLGTLADADIDWHEENANSESLVHRPATGVEMGETAGFLNRSRGAFSVAQNHDVGWNDTGDWMNYTRDFLEPARDYHVFAALASGGGNIAARLDEVTAGMGTTNQTRSELGQFNAPPTGGWNSYILVPLQNATNGIARVNLGGRRTVRFTTLPGSLNVDYVMLVPAGTGEPDLSALRPKNISAPIQLQAGQRYFIEALMKEGDGGDNLAVAWRKPGDVAVTNETPPIPGAFLSGLAPSEPAVIASQPQSQLVAEYSTVIMTVGLTGTMPYDYQWYRDGEMLIGENRPALVLPSVSAALSNSTFHVVCGNGLNSIRSQDASLGVTADLVVPELVFTEGRASLDEVGVGFSEPIDAADVVNVERYQISGGVAILSASLWGNQRLVVLKTTPQTPGQSYTLTVNGIHDRAASRNVISANSQRTFTGFNASQPVSPLPPGYQRITVTTRTGPVTVVIPRREFHFDPPGQTFYLATNGNDGNPGTIAQPWRTFAYALDQLQPGDLLYVRAGDYPEPFVIRRSGLLGKPIIFSAYPGEPVHIFPPPGWEPAPGTTHGANTIQIDASHIWIHGFEIKGPPRELGFRPLGTSILSAIQLGGGGVGCRILNNNCYQSQYSGIKDQTGSFDYLVEGNICFDNGTPIDETYPRGAGLYLPGPAKTGTIVRGNAIFRNGGVGFSHYHRPANHHVYNNVIFDNGTERGAFGLVTSGHHNVYAHNVVLDNVDGGISFFGAGAEGLPNDNLVINSIIADNSSYQLGKTDDPPLGNLVDFCLVSPSQTWASPLSRISAISGPGILFHSPLFEDESGHDYRNAAGGYGRMAAGSVALLGTRPQPHLGLFPATEYWEPIIVPFPDPTVNEGSELRFVVQLEGAAAPGTQIEFRLADFPPHGAIIDPQTGEFRWTPNEFQGPGVYQITVVAMADNSPVVYGAKTFSVSVNDVNSPPVIGLASLTNSSDFTGVTDLARDGYAWSPGILETLGNGAFRVTAFGGGQDYFSDSGFFAWREVSGDFDARVRLSGLKAASSFTRAGLMVRESLEPDSRMSLGHIFPAGMAEDGYPGRNGYAFDRRLGTGTQTIPQMEISTGLPLPNAWLRLHRAGNSLSYYRGTNGTDWTLLLSQVTEPLPKVIYLGLATLSARGETNVFTVADYHDYLIQHTVPQPVPALTVSEGNLIRLAFAAQDFDRPENTLTFSLGSGAPAGAAIDPISGEFNWTPSDSDGGQSFSIAVLVTDSGVPPFTATNSFTVVVNKANSAPSLPTTMLSSPIHRYSFSGNANDSVGTAHGILQGSATVRDGQLVLDGSGAYLDLPNNLVTGLTSITIEAWVTDTGSDGWARIFDFGNSSGGENLQGNGTQYMFLSLPAGGGNLRGAYSLAGGGSAEQIVEWPGNRPAVGQKAHIVWMTDGATHAGRLYVNGVLVGNNNNVTLTPAAIGPTFNVWLGRSQYNDPYFKGSIDEFRIYSQALSAADVQTHFLLGPEASNSPVLSTLTINELTALTFTNAATDLDLPFDTLDYSLVSPPDGAEINASGVITWTPNEAQAPSTNVITTMVKDDGVPPLNATNTFTVVVNEVNAAPSLTVPPSATIDELVAYSANASATDADLPANTFTFERVSGPSGLTVSSAGAINWTPDEAQGPGVFPVTVRVFDNGSPSLGATQTFTLTVSEVNTVPVLPDQTNRVIEELTMLTVTNTATDADLPTISLTYSLLAAPGTASISPSGLITWTPSEADGPGTNTFTTRVVDNGVPSLSTTNTFTVIVNEMNVAPMLAMANTNINELVSFTATVLATDSDLPINPISYAKVSGPASLTVSASGVINWTPAENEGPSTNTVMISVTDTNPIAVNSTSLSYTNSFQVVVNEVNIAPVMGPLTERTVNPGQTISFSATATDADLPVNTLAYSLVSPPTGANITTGGLFTWRPGVALANTTNTIQVRVQDNGAPVSNDVKSFSVIVNPLAPVTLMPGSFSNGQFRFQMSGIAGPDYVVSSSSNLTQWSDLFTNLSPAMPFQFIDSSAGSFSNRAYRVRLEP